MPVWLALDQAEEWIKADANGAMAMLLVSEPPAMDAYRVNRAVNSKKYNSVESLLPIT